VHLLAPSALSLAGATPSALVVNGTLHTHTHTHTLPSLAMTSRTKELRLWSHLVPTCK
jgi:hypothetical protein